MCAVERSQQHTYRCIFTERQGNDNVCGYTCTQCMQCVCVLLGPNSTTARKRTVYTCNKALAMCVFTRVHSVYRVFLCCWFPTAQQHANTLHILRTRALSCRDKALAMCVGTRVHNAYSVFLCCCVPTAQQHAKTLYILRTRALSCGDKSTQTHCIYCVHVHVLALSCRDKKVQERGLSCRDKKVHV